MLKRPVILCASLLFAAVFVAGLVHLFDLRLDQGDIYPKYSTLRSDPLGASVFYESLEQVPGVSPQRYFDETFKIDDGSGHALFVLGTSPFALDMMPRSEYETLQRFVFNGGRVVIAYYPRVDKPHDEPWYGSDLSTNETDEARSDVKKSHRSHRKKAVSSSASDDATNLDENADSPAGTNDLSSTTNSLSVTNKPAKIRHDRNSRRPQDSPDGETEADQQEFHRHYADLYEEWGFHLDYQWLATNQDGQMDFPKAGLVAKKTDLPPQLAIHTSLCFTNLTNGWATIYQRDKKTPVVIERKFGAGSVVLVADSYPFSNEAMFKDRSASLISWMLGGGHEVIFEEAHLGIVEQPGMATLMRRYQLHGLIFSLLLVAGLYVWKNAISLVPPHAEPVGDAGLVVAGRDSASGFVNLVRRSVSPAELINVCFAEWKKSGARAAAVSPGQRQVVEQVVSQQAALPPKEREPVGNYRAISEILKRRH
ncbi:MAG: DUF4350 domain-containing protein [Verrucomicrobiae bacterium]|nr:DUF4350 domain-containing protein [Verrucomicrobiae bacterium]